MAAAADTADAGVIEADAEANGGSLTAEASQIIRRHTAYAAAGGLVAIPVVELAICTTIQLRMIAKLCDEYGVRFSENAVKASVGALVGSVIPISSIGYSVFAAARSVPGVGQILGVLTLPVLAGALTWAVGRVFAWHFAGGGSLEDFDAEAAKDRFKEEFEEGKRRAKGSTS
ncbi:MAG: DUF697 domain-containing protein [Alphaproteobacteria bacterium]|nr:DUF697 domain-containing protein [Alphaproteobacteria bacterium]